MREKIRNEDQWRYQDFPENDSQKSSEDSFCNDAKKYNHPVTKPVLKQT